MKSPRSVVYDDGQLFKVEHQLVEGRELPYEFVSRVGAVTILPIIHQRPADPQALVIHNKRLYYGSSVGLPGGNLDGGFENPEPPAVTAERELREETGYGYEQPEDRDISTFALRNLSNTIAYTRYFAVMRGVRGIGGADDNPHEIVTLRPMPLDAYVDPLFRLSRGEMYPEVNAAFAKANMELGRDAVMGWLVGDDIPGAARVPETFEPWLLPVAA
jgi:8-oxo-dGTP pyrophosphatase MutT (NUDIX family)